MLCSLSGFENFKVYSGNFARQSVLIIIRGLFYDDLSKISKFSRFQLTTTGWNLLRDTISFVIVDKLLDMLLFFNFS